ncbi:MAG: hypothetical protein ABI663_11020 [Chryseolinea sp.]
MDNDKLIKEYHDRNVRWTNESLKQLSFYNNLLLTLSVGFLGFSFKLDNFGGLRLSYSSPNWSLTFLVFSIILVTLSVVTGLLLALNRLQDVRLTRQINQIRQRILEHSGAKLDDKTPDKFNFWRKLGLAFQNYPTVTMEECKGYESADQSEKDRIKFNFRELRNIAHNLGLKTWQQTTWQSVFFGLSIVSYLASRLIN